MNESTEEQFCKSDATVSFDNSGSSRWRQRAFYDFLKDVSSKIIKIPVIRISIYDNFKGNSLNKLLQSNSQKGLAEFIKERVRLSKITRVIRKS